MAKARRPSRHNVRFTLVLREEENEELERLTERHGCVSNSETLREALELLADLGSEVQKGAEIVLQYPDRAPMRYANSTLMRAARRLKRSRVPRLKKVASADK